jgi:hypothetical protein
MDSGWHPLGAVRLSTGIQGGIGAAGTVTSDSRRGLLRDCSMPLLENLSPALNRNRKSFGNFSRVRRTCRFMRDPDVAEECETSIQITRHSDRRIDKSHAAKPPV